jgi:hypothetical protein
MPRPERVGAEQEQTPEQIAAALEGFLADYPAAVVMEDGKVLFDMRDSRYSLSTEHNRCTLHLWSEERNLVRRVSACELRNKVLRLATIKFGQARAQTLELAGDKDRRTPSAREATRTRYVKVLERALLRHMPDWRVDSFSTAMDLERSFGPAYARGVLTLGTKAWAAIGVNDEEAQTTIDGVLTFGLLWLEACRAASGGRRLVQGLMVVVPQRTGTTTLSRMAWLAGDGSCWRLLELDQRAEEMQERDAADQGNLATRLVHAPNGAAARQRFSESAARILAICPAGSENDVEQRLRSGTELAFLLHGLEFARVRLGASNQNFNRVERVTFGAGPAETELTPETESALRHLVARLWERRSPTADKRDPLFRMQPERWLEGRVRQNLGALDRSLEAGPCYSQVPAFAGAGDRGMLDLLSVGADGRLVVIELKAAEDPQLALQGLDYWIRVRWHHSQNPDAQSGLGEFQRHGYFGDVRLSELAPRLLLVAPALRVHPATEVVLRRLSPRVEWTLIGLDERWREHLKVVWRKRSSD